MNEEEMIAGWKERCERIKRMNRKRIYALVFQGVTSFIVLLFAFNGMIDAIVSAGIILVIMVITMLLNHVVHRRTQKIIWEQKEKIDAYVNERET